MATAARQARTYSGDTDEMTDGAQSDKARRYGYATEIWEGRRTRKQEIAQATCGYATRTRLAMTLGDETVPVKCIRLSEIRAGRREAGRDGIRPPAPRLPMRQRQPHMPQWMDVATDGYGYRSAPPPLLICSVITSRKLSPCIMRRRAAANSAFGRRTFAALPPNLAA